MTGKPGGSSIQNMTKREKYVVCGILAVFALGLLFHGLNRYGPYQDYIDISPSLRGQEEKSGTQASETDARTENSSGPSAESDISVYPNGTREREVLMININSAGLYDLMKLPGVGKVTALNIIDYRTVHGPFMTVDELIEVNGIGEKKLEMLRQYVTIR